MSSCGLEIMWHEDPKTVSLVTSREQKYSSFPVHSLDPVHITHNNPRKLNKLAEIFSALALCFGPDGWVLLPCFLCPTHKAQAIYEHQHMFMPKNPLPSISMGAFFSHLVVPGVLAVQQALAIPLGPPLVHLGCLASLAVLGGQGHLWGDRDESLWDLVSRRC